MPILKPISGHGSTGGIRRYLEKGGRALARDLFNLSYDERDAGALGDEAKEACAWDAEMDATRAAFGTDAPWRGKPARTFKHFVLSPDPGDDIDLAALRELACSWALKHFGDHEIVLRARIQAQGGHRRRLMERKRLLGWEGSYIRLFDFLRQRAGSRGCEEAASDSQGNGRGYFLGFGGAALRHQPRLRPLHHDRRRDSKKGLLLRPVG